MDNGYSVDFISDNFISQATFKDGLIVLPGGTYKSLVIPNCEKMPMATLEKLIALKKLGAPIIFEGLPKSVPGFYNYEVQNSKLSQVISENNSLLTLTSNVFKDLETANVFPETLVKTGLKFIRRAIDGEKIYYVVNHTSKIIDDYIPLAIKNKEVIILDPLTKKYGNALVKKETNATLVKLRIEPGQSFILKTETSKSYPNWNYYKATENPINLEDNWRISFEKGGPELPPSAKINTLQSWTALSPEAEAFSGTALYTLEFNAPEIEADNWKLNLGDVRESAKVWLNGNYIGDVWSVPFSINLGQLKKGKNELKIQVTNLAANRIRAKEMRGEEWKIFYEINMVDKDYKKFDATKWQPMPSGLLGPISITPLRMISD
jgi:hypothetical protein